LPRAPPPPPPDATSKCHAPNVRIASGSMLSSSKSWQHGRKILDIIARGPLLPLDLEAIASLMPRADLSVLDREGSTSLIRAAMNKTCSLQLFCSLLAASAPVSVANVYGFTALSQASALCRLQFVVALLAHGADPNTSSTASRSTPLTQAAQCEAANSFHSAAVAFALLRAGACPHAIPDGESALASAAKLGREDVVGVLLDAHATSGARHSCAAGVQSLHPGSHSPRLSKGSAHMLLFGTEISRLHVAHCRDAIIARASLNSNTVVAPLLPPLMESSRLLCALSPLFPRQRSKLLAAAASSTFFLICRLAGSTRRVLCGRNASRLMRRWLLLRACDARLPYRIALLQSAAVASAAASAARAVAAAAMAVEAALHGQGRGANQRTNKKRPRAAQCGKLPKIK
jgi:hypothetical protein